MSALSRVRVPADAFWIAALVLWVGVTHTGFLAREVVDWDESTFVLVAASMLDGHLPYVALFDFKPPMIYFMLAGAMAAFGESMPVVRLFGAACVLASSIAVFAIARRLTDPVSAGLAALMLVAVTAVSNEGAVLSELPATVLLMTALWLCLARGDRLWAAAATGAFLALAVLTRTNLIVVVAALGLWLVCAAPAGARLRTGAVLALAAAAPPISIFLLYWSVGALAELRLVFIDIPLAFAEHAVDPAEALRNFAKKWLHFLEWRRPRVFGPFTLGVVVGLAAAAWILFSGERRERWEIASSLLIFVAVFVSILFFSDAKGYPHYWLQLFPVLAILCAVAIAWARRAAGRRWIAYAAILLCCAGTVWRTGPAAVHVAVDLAGGGIFDGYAIRRAARAIAEVRQPGEQVWAIKGHLVYWYLDTLPRSRLPHPSDIAKPWIVEPLAAAGYVRRDVLRATMAARPVWLVTRGRNPAPSYLPDDDAARLRRMIADDYTVFHGSREIRVYRRLWRGGGAPDSPGAERR